MCCVSGRDSAAKTKLAVAARIRQMAVVLASVQAWAERQGARCAVSNARDRSYLLHRADCERPRRSVAA